MFLVGNRNDVEVSIAGELGMHDDTEDSPFEIDQQVFGFGVPLIFKRVNFSGSGGDRIAIRSWYPGKSQRFEKLQVRKSELRSVGVGRIWRAMDMEVIPDDSLFDPRCFD